MYQEKIGIIGGFGAYATLNFYKRILEVFASESERDYPHIVMDNNFTMPSRTRALLYNEKCHEIVTQIEKSMEMLLQQGVSQIILVCGTAHYFLDEVFKRLPEAKDKTVNIIEVVRSYLKEKNIGKVLVIAAEGTLKKELYSKELRIYGVSCIEPLEEDYGEIRYFIECVKKNEMNLETAQRYLAFLRRFNINQVVPGCTEFPILHEFIDRLDWGRQQRDEWNKYQFHDPLEITIQMLHATLK